MRIFLTVLHRQVLSMACIAVLLFTVAEQVQAFDLNITAMFKPDSANPMKREFKNTTQESGYCFYYPNECGALKIIGFRLETEFTAQYPIEANHPLESQGAMFGVPGQWRSLSVTNVDTQETKLLEVRIAAIGATHHLGGTAIQDVVGMPSNTPAGRGWDALWGGQGWAYGAGPCKAATYTGITSYIYSFFYYVPLVDDVCAKQAKFDIPVFKYTSLDLGYELRTPNPLTMSSGIYKGDITYALGRGGIDLGDNIKANNGDTVINLNFLLDVQHTLKVELPPGGNRVELVPQGGWQSWLTQGRKPTRLFRDQTFNISASSHFKMQLVCEHSTDGKSCALRDPVSETLAQVDVSVTLPYGLTVGEQPVTRLPLLQGDDSEVFQPVLYVDRKPGTLHFEIPPSTVDTMIRPGAQKRYSGKVTVIWDSEVG